MCDGSGSGPPKLNDVLWVGQPTHRSVGEDQVILTACNISDSNETSRGAPTAAREVSHIQLHNT